MSTPRSPQSPRTPKGLDASSPGGSSDNTSGRVRLSRLSGMAGGASPGNNEYHPSQWKVRETPASARCVFSSTGSGMAGGSSPSNNEYHPSQWKVREGADGRQSASIRCRVTPSGRTPSGSGWRAHRMVARQFSAKDPLSLSPGKGLHHQRSSRHAMVPLSDARKILKIRHFSERRAPTPQLRPLQPGAFLSVAWARAWR